MTICRKLAFITALVFLIQFSVFSQAPEPAGMTFEHLPGWNDVLAKAKKTKKMIFLDCYTTWCGPCKVMSAQVFTQKEVGNFYNAHFINAKVQLDTTDNDDNYIKGWYKDGHDLAKKYKVRAFPTYLIFDSDGGLVHRFVGSMPPAGFIAAGRELLNPDNQYYTQLRKYENGDKSPQLLYQLVNLSQKAYDNVMSKKLAEEYLATQTDLYTKDNLKLLYKAAKSSMDKGFAIALNEADKADKILEEPGRSKKLVRGIIVNEELPGLLGKGGTPDFEAYDKSLNEKYPAYAKWVSDYSKMYYNQAKKNWDEFARYAHEIVKAGDVQPGNLNSFAWTVFEKVTDKHLLEKALGWSKESIKEEQKAAYMDTYANLLYKAGRSKEAILEQTKAIEAAKKENGNVEELEATLEKMKKGEPTWPQE